VLKQVRKFVDFEFFPRLEQTKQRSLQLRAVHADFFIARMLSDCVALRYLLNIRRFVSFFRAAINYLAFVKRHVKGLLLVDRRSIEFQGMSSVGISHQAVLDFAVHLVVFRDAHDPFVYHGCQFKSFF